MEQNLTFDQLPKAVTMLAKEVSELKSLIIDRQGQALNDHPEQFLTIQEASDFLNLKVPTLYSKVSRNEIPYMKRAKRLYFSKSELMEYIKEGRHKTVSEMEQEAGSYLLNKKGLEQ
ncbi:MAG: DNA-binding protein [Bacteroidetes bacterium]|nr:MAG: DNA-binding protein [Bacteroidota bacterium]